MTDSLCLGNAFVQFQETLVRTVHILARSREKAGFAAAFLAQAAVLALHSVHICCRRSHVGDVAGKAWQAVKASDLREDGLLTAGLYELALMCCNGTEVTTSEASSVSVDRELDHLERRDVLSFVTRMRLLGERKVPERVHFLLSSRRIGWVYLHISVSDRLHQHRRMHHICVSLDDMEILCKCDLVLAASFKRIQHHRVCDLAAAVHIESQLRDLSDVRDVSAGFDGAGQLEHRPLPHSVTEPVCTAGHKDRRHKFVLPIIVMRHTPEGSFYSTDHNRHIRPQLLEDLCIYGHGIVRPLSGLAFRGVGVVAAEPLGRGVVVHHRVHRTGIHTEIKPRSAQLAEVAKVVSPVRLRHDSHPVAIFLKPSGNHRRTERRMIDKSVTSEYDDVNIVPSKSLDLFGGGRDHMYIVLILHTRANISNCLIIPIKNSRGSRNHCEGPAT